MNSETLEQKFHKFSKFFSEIFFSQEIHKRRHYRNGCDVGPCDGVEEHLYPVINAHPAPQAEDTHSGYERHDVPHVAVSVRVFIVRILEKV